MKTEITKTDIIFAILIATCVLILTGANIARRQIEKNKMENTLVQPEGSYAHTATR